MEARHEKRVAWLDGWRGLSCLVIYGHHLGKLTSPWGHTVEQDTFPALFGMDHMVLVWFNLLSGYLMELTTSKCYKNSLTCFFAFYWKRLSRIYPTFLFSLLVSVPDLACLWRGTCDDARLSAALTPFFLRNWILHNRDDYIFLWCGVNWSLGVEMFCYLLFPFL